MDNVFSKSETFKSILDGEPEAVPYMVVMFMLFSANNLVSFISSPGLSSIIIDIIVVSSVVNPALVKI